MYFIGYFRVSLLAENICIHIYVRVCVCVRSLCILAWAANKAIKGCPPGAKEIIGRWFTTDNTAVSAWKTLKHVINKIIQRLQQECTMYRVNICIVVSYVLRRFGWFRVCDGRDRNEPTKVRNCGFSAPAKRVLDSTVLGFDGPFLTFPYMTVHVQRYYIILRSKSTGVLCQKVCRFQAGNFISNEQTRVGKNSVLLRHDKSLLVGRFPLVGLA